eukprot:s894_g7.t1
MFAAQVAFLIFSICLALLSLQAAVGRLGTLRRQLAEASAQTAWRWQQLPQLQRALRELVGTQRDILAGLRSQTLDGLNFDALCMDLPQFPVGDGAARSPVVSQVHALGRELKAELQASRGALKSTMTSLRALEPSFEAEAGRAGEVLEILCASLPPDLPDSVQSLLDKAHLQAVAREEVPSQILDALVAEIRASLQAGRDVKEPGTEALSEMLPSEIARVEEACAQQIRAKEDDLKAAASRCRRDQGETRQSENSQRWAKESEDAQKELDEVWKSLATARKEIQAIREVRSSCEKATEKHRDRLWDVEQTATDVKERRTVELRRAEMELQPQLRGYAERTQELTDSERLTSCDSCRLFQCLAYDALRYDELEIQIRHEEEDQQQTWREGAMALAAELTPELDEVLKVHAELEAETLRLLQRGKDQLFAHAGALSLAFCPLALLRALCSFGQAQWVTVLTLCMKIHGGAVGNWDEDLLKNLCFKASEDDSRFPEGEGAAFAGDGEFDFPGNIWEAEIVDIQSGADMKQLSVFVMPRREELRVVYTRQNRELTNGTKEADKALEVVKAGLQPEEYPLKAEDHEGNVETIYHDKAEARLEALRPPPRKENCIIYTADHTFLTYDEVVGRYEVGNPLQPHEFPIKVFYLKNHKEVKQLFPDKGKVQQEGTLRMAWDYITRASLGLSVPEQAEAKQAVLTLFDIEASKEEMEAIHRDILKMPVMAADGSPSSAEGSP